MYWVCKFFDKKKIFFIVSFLKFIYLICRNRTDGMTIDELIHRLTIAGEYGTHDDPFTITFFVLYRTFMRPRDVLTKLMQKFIECEKNVRDHRNTTHEK